MTSAYSVSVKFPGYATDNFITLTGVAALQRIVSTTIADGASALLNGSTVPGDGGGGFYCYVASSTAVEDGMQVVKPSDLGPTEAGRWMAITIAGVSATALVLTETAVANVAIPKLGHQSIFIDSADHKMKRKDASGTITTIG